MGGNPGALKKTKGGTRQCRDSYSPENKLASPACRRCGHNDFTREPAKPPHYQAERCKSCGLFSRFVAKPRLSIKPGYPEVGEQLRAGFDSPRDKSHKSCHERFEKVEKEIGRINLELLFYNRIFGQVPAPRPVQDSFEREITGEQVLTFNRIIDEQ